jgi:hypothetical protein
MVCIIFSSLAFSNSNKKSYTSNLVAFEKSYLQCHIVLVQELYLGLFEYYSSFLLYTWLKLDTLGHPSPNNPSIVYCPGPGVASVLFKESLFELPILILGDVPLIVGL